MDFKLIYSVHALTRQAIWPDSLNLNLLVLGREAGKILRRDYVGIILLRSLVRTS